MNLNDLFNKLTNFKMKVKGVEEIQLSNKDVHFLVYSENNDQYFEVNFESISLSDQKNAILMRFK